MPDLTDAESIFLTIRAFRSAATYGPLLAQYRDLLKPEAIAEVELGQSLTTAAVAQAMVRHGATARPHAPVRGALRVHAVRRESAAAVRREARLAEGDRRRRDGALHRLAEVVLLDHGDVPSRDLGARGLHARRACPSASRSSAAIATTSACCSSATRSSRRRRSVCAGRRSPEASAREGSDADLVANLCEERPTHGPRLLGTVRRSPRPRAGSP